MELTWQDALVLNMAQQERRAPFGLSVYCMYLDHFVPHPMKRYIGCFDGVDSFVQLTN